MQLDAVPPQTPQPKPDPNGKPGPHSPQPDPIPRKVAYDIHAVKPLRWEMSEMFPGMVCRKPQIRMVSNAGRGYIVSHRPVIA